MNAIADAIGDEIFQRSPVSADIILNALENGGKRTHEALHGSHLGRQIEAIGLKSASDPLDENRYGRDSRHHSGVRAVPAGDRSTMPMRLLDKHGADALVLAGGLDSMDWLKDRLKRPKVGGRPQPDQGAAGHQGSRTAASRSAR